jgi:hypothetical protein
MRTMVATSATRAQSQTSDAVNVRILRQTRANIAYYAAHPEQIDARLGQLDGIQGWCPPLPAFRRLGVRAQAEIQMERNALRALRGDFDDTADASGLVAAERELIKGTSNRVALNTDREVNDRIHAELERRLVFFAEHPEAIEQRLSELDQEWDIERLIENEAPIVTITGLFIGMAYGRKGLRLPLFAQGMLFVHALQGWYPLLPLFRRMGFRTPKEIATER